MLANNSFSILLFFIIALVGVVTGQNNEKCSVCGDGLIVTKRNEIFAYPGQPVLACGKLEEAGEEGSISLSYCETLPELISDTCGCKEVEGVCSVCGDGKKVSLFEEIFAFPQQPVVSCEALEDAGRIGLVPVEYCGLLSELIQDTCGCIPKSQPIPPTRAPTIRHLHQPRQPASQIATTATNSSQFNGLSTRAIIAIIIAVVVVGGLLILLVYMSTSGIQKNEPIIITAEAIPVTASTVIKTDEMNKKEKISSSSVTDKDLL